MERDIGRKVDVAMMRFPVTHRVVQRFARNPKHRYLDSRWESRHWRWRCERHGEVFSSVLEPVDVILQCRHQADGIERRVTKGVHETPDVLDRSAGIGARLRQERLGPIGVTTKAIAGGVHLERDGSQLRSEPVMQVALKTAAFLLAGRDKTFPSFPELLNQHGRMDRGPNLVGYLDE
jgi:hypothetical protein